MNSATITSRIALGLTALFLLAWQAPASAQAAINIAPEADTVSPSGVSYKSGAFSAGGTVDLSIGGSGIAGLHLIRSYLSTDSPNMSDLTNGQGWSFNVVTLLTRNKYVYPPDQEPPPNPNNIPWMYTVSTGTKTVTFKGTGANVPPATYTLTKLGGEKLVFTQVGTGLAGSGSYFTFTDSDGSVYVYSWDSNRLQTVTYPDGTKLDFTYQTAPSSNRVIKSIISNRGYAILSDGNTQMCVVNMAETYVTASSSCPVGAQSVTYTRTVSVPAYSSTITNLTSFTNALGQTTAYSYVGADHLGCIKDPGQVTCRISNVYNVCTGQPGFPPPANLRWSDQVISQTTGTGESYSYSYLYSGDYEYCSDYTGYGAVTTMVGPGSATWVAYANGIGASEGITDPLNRGNTNTYFDGITGFAPESAVPLGQFAQEGNGIYFNRDARGNITAKILRAKTGSGQSDVTVETASYPATCANPKTCNKPDYVVDANGNRTDFTWDSNHGGITSIKLPAATVGGIRPEKRFTYTQLYAWIKNSGGGYVQAATPVWMLTGTSECRTTASCAGGADEIKTTITYGTTGVANNLLPTAVSVGSGDNLLVATTAFTYDFTGNVLTIDGPLSGSADTTRYRYDALRRVIGVVGPDPDGGGALKNRATRSTYDPAGNLTKVERGTVNSQSDGDWAAFSSLEAVDVTYDVMGRVLKSAESGGGTVYTMTQYSYDASGRLQCTAVRMDPAVWNSQTNACLPQTAGPNGPDRITRNVYNLAGDRTKMQVAVGAGVPVEGDEVTSTYSNNDHVATVTDGEGHTTTFSYDAYDRFFKTIYADTSYEQLTMDFKNIVHQRRLRDGQVVNFSYDNLDRITLKDLPAPETDVSYSNYDLQGNPGLVASATSLTFSFDALGRKKSETGPLGTMSFDYDLLGRRVKTSWGDGYFASLSYLLTGEVSQIRENQTTPDTGVLANYSYDDLGRRTQLARANGVWSNYSYDGISRLSGLSHNLTGTAQDVGWSFTYNPASQITSSTRNNDLYAWNGHYNLNRVDTVNSLNQVTAAGSTSIGYDSRGNLTSSGSNTYAYTAENRLVSGPGGATLQYDPAGRLYESSKAGVTTRFQYDGAEIVAEYNASNVLQRRYFHGPDVDEPLVWLEGAGTSDPRWYHQDERGSIVALSDGSGTSIATNTYDECGVPGAGNLGRFGYTGQTWLPEINQNYYKARMYSPTLGRFMQTDPIGYAAGMNIYEYVGGDPVNAVDPLGEDGVNVGCEGTCYNIYYVDGIGLYSNQVDAHNQKREAKLAETDANVRQNQMRQGSLWNSLLAPWGGWSGIKSAWDETIHGGLPGNGDLDSQLAAFPIGGVAVRVEAAAVEGTGNALRLAKQLASEEGVAELLAGGGKAIAGAGTKVPIRDIGRLVSEYGGKAEDWAKVTSTAASHAQTHAYRNIVTGEVVELKSLFP